jgi:hypothetical protein
MPTYGSRPQRGSLGRPLRTSANSPPDKAGSQPDNRDVKASGFWLPVEHAAVLTGDNYDNLAPVAYLVSVITRQGDAVAKCFTEGGGVPWAAYVPEVHDVMDVLWQPMYRDLLVQEIPAARAWLD